MSGPTAEAAPDKGGQDSIAGPKHNQDQPVVWERWQKKRTFVRALEGTYSHLTKELLDQPRVISSKDVPWKGGPQSLRQACHRAGRGGQDHAVDRDPYRGLCAGRLQPEARPSELAPASTSSRAAATTSMTADASSGRPAT